MPTQTTPLRDLLTRLRTVGEKPPRKLFDAIREHGQDAFKFVDLPLTNYATLSYDKVTRNGKNVGFSTFSSYSYNERSMLSLGIIDNEHAEVGTEVTLLWGEEGGGSSKPTVERHRQIETRAKVGPVPYARDARETYAEGWRTTGKQ